MTLNRRLLPTHLTVAGASLLLLAAGSGSMAQAETPLGQGGYLDAATLQIIVSGFPGPPAVGSEQDLADKAASAQYRLLEDSARWQLATSHTEMSPRLALQHFDCTLGFRLSTAETPRVQQIFMRLLMDANGAAEHIKALGHRPRPTGDDRERRACQRINEAGRNTPSYPSGTAAVAAAYGEAMADLVPEQAEALRATAHQISLSRLVCGMHYPTDIRVGGEVGQAVFKATSTNPAYRADIEAAKAEIHAARALGQTNPSCAAERAGLAIPLPEAD